jgi:hypothetical protein
MGILSIFWFLFYDVFSFYNDINFENIFENYIEFLTFLANKLAT